eukprot:16182-Heterococcus_DN1.PRE.3
MYCMSEQSVSTSVLQLAAGAATWIMTSTFMPSRSSSGRVVLVSSWSGLETGGARSSAYTFCSEHKCAQDERGSDSYASIDGDHMHFISLHCLLCYLCLKWLLQSRTTLDTNAMQSAVDKHRSFGAAIHMYVFESSVHVCSAARLQLLISNCNVATEGCSHAGAGAAAVHVLLSP